MWLVLVLAGFLGGVASILLRVAALAEGGAFWVPLLLRGLALLSYGAGFALYAVALRRTSLATAYPLMVAASVLVVLVFSALHEQTFKASQAIGALAVVVGVWVAASGR